MVYGLDDLELPLKRYEARLQLAYSDGDVLEGGYILEIYEQFGVLDECFRSFHILRFTVERRNKKF